MFYNWLIKRNNDEYYKSAAKEVLQHFETLMKHKKIQNNSLKKVHTRFTFILYIYD